MATLEKAIEIAARAHAGQKDKAGRPYVLHPLRVMLGVKSETGRIAATLHDVVEDTPVTLRDLQRDGFSEDVLQIVDLLTHRKREGESESEYWARVRTHPVAVEVKLADLRDNMARSWRAPFIEKDVQRRTRYRRAWKFLTGVDWPQNEWRRPSA